MLHRISMASAAALTLLAVSVRCPDARAGENDLKEREIYRLISAAHRTTLTMSSPQGSMAVPDPNTLITMSDSNGKQIVGTLIEKGGGAAIVDELKTMKPGDYATATFETKFNISYIKTFAPYKMFDGEAQANVFTFVESAKREQGAETQVAVQLYKLGKLVTARVPSAKDAAGKLAPDAKIAAAVDGASKGDIVEVEAAGNPPVIKTFAKYLPPVTGVIAEIKQVDVDGGKTTALELTVDGAAREFLVPGKTDAKGVFQPDLAAMTAIKRFKAKDRVAVKYRSEGGKDYIRDIASALAPRTGAGG